jgi:tetratricopeptide (TPR) repeat protein
MFSLAELRIVLVAAVLTAAAAPAFPVEPQTRAEALTALNSPDAAKRAEAIVWIANNGNMADTELLHERLRDESPFVRGFAEQGLWALWSRSGDTQVDALMAKGAEEMEADHYAEAITLFSEVIRRKPEFAEGWNRRATVYYLAGDYARSLADCDQVLRRNPGHFGALSGVGQIYARLEEYEQALVWFRRALDVNPNMLGVEINMREIEEKLKAKRGRMT